jgi:hypothetical protein
VRLFHLAVVDDASFPLSQAQHVATQISGDFAAYVREHSSTKTAINICAQLLIHSVDQITVGTHAGTYECPAAVQNTPDDLQTTSRPSNADHRPLTGPSSTVAI